MGGQIRKKKLRELNGNNKTVATKIKQEFFFKQTKYQISTKPEKTNFQKPHQKSITEPTQK